MGWFKKKPAIVDTRSRNARGELIPDEIRRNHQYRVCPAWSAALNRLIDAVLEEGLPLKPGCERGLTHKFGNVVVWTANWPSAYGHPYMTRCLDETAVPDPITLHRLRDLVDGALTSDSYADAVMQRIEDAIYHHRMTKRKALDEADAATAAKLDEIASRLSHKPDGRE